MYVHTWAYEFDIIVLYNRLLVCRTANVWRPSIRARYRTVFIAVDVDATSHCSHTNVITTRQWLTCDTCITEHWIHVLLKSESLKQSLDVYSRRKSQTFYIVLFLLYILFETFSFIKGRNHLWMEYNKFRPIYACRGCSSEVLG